MCGVHCVGFRCAGVSEYSRAAIVGFRARVHTHCFFGTMRPFALVVVYLARLKPFAEIEASDMSALEAVLAVDEVRTALEAEADTLSKLMTECDVCAVMCMFPSLRWFCTR